MRTHRADFHTHTNFSDGALSLAELIKMAQDRSLELIVVCDHDTFKTFSPANIANTKQLVPELEDLGDTMQAGRLKIVKGIEFSANHSKSQIHIVGMYISSVPQKMEVYFDKLGDERAKRAQKLADRMNVNFGDVLRVAGPANSITRLHVGRVIYDNEERNPVRIINDKRHPKYSSAHDVTEKLMPRKHKDYLSVPRENVMASEEVISAILGLGGIPVWAHPAMESAPLEATIVELNKYAGQHLFIEGYSGNCSERENKLVTKYARAFGMPVLHSSDFHGGQMKENTLGYTLRHPEYKTVMKAVRNSLKDIRASKPGKAQ
jgi:hypothetical protein